MSASEAIQNTAAGKRVLVLGRSPEVLDIVLQELVDYGLHARGTTDVNRATEQFDAGEFDLIAFGRGLADAPSERLKREFTRQSAKARFLHTWAPLAARQIIDMLEGTSRSADVDLDAYCRRIGYRGPRTPTMETLKALHELHPDAIVFEAVDVLLNRGIDLSPGAVDAKLIRSDRGGYCFEQNNLFKRVLTAMGFEVEGLVGRVRWMDQPGAPARPRTHMALRVTVNGEPWLADVGFGGQVPTSPLRMDTTAPQPTRHETFRVIPFGDSLLVQSRLGDRWTSLYELSREPQLDVDFELANWFTATHPSSHFRHGLTAARTTPEARYALLNGRFTIRTPGSGEDRRMLDAEAIEQTLVETFHLPVEPDWRPAIQRAAAAGASQ